MVPVATVHYCESFDLLETVEGGQIGAEIVSLKTYRECREYSPRRHQEELELMFFRDGTYRHLCIIYCVVSLQRLQCSDAFQAGVPAKTAFVSTISRTFPFSSFPAPKKLSNLHTSAIYGPR